MFFFNGPPFCISVLDAQHYDCFGSIPDRRKLAGLTAGESDAARWWQRTDSNSARTIVITRRNSKGFVDNLLQVTGQAVVSRLGKSFILKTSKTICHVETLQVPDLAARASEGSRCIWTGLRHTGCHQDRYVWSYM